MSVSNDRVTGRASSGDGARPAVSVLAPGAVPVLLRRPVGAVATEGPKG